MTVFHRAKIGTTTVASAYTAGSGSLTVVDGSQFGTVFPIVVIVSRAGVRMSVLEVTARATNTLTVSGAVDGTTDVNLLVGDIVKEGPTALQTNELQDAINALPAYDQFSNLVTPEVSITGTTALTSAAFGKLHVCSGTSANYTVTLPSPTGNAGRWIGVRMSPALTKFVTIAKNGSETINGAASRLMWANEAATLLCDGTNWFKLSGRSIPMFAELANSTYVTVPNATWFKLALDTIGSDNTGIMADLANSQFIIRRTGTYSIAFSTEVQNASVTSNYFSSPYWNNTGLVPFILCIVAGTYPKSFFVEESSMTAGDFVDLRINMSTTGVTQVAGRMTLKESNVW